MQSLFYFFSSSLMSKIKDKVLSFCLILDCFWVYNVAFFIKRNHDKATFQQDYCPWDGDVKQTVVLSLLVAVLNIVFPLLYAFVFTTYYLLTSHVLELYLKERFLRGRIPFAWLLYDAPLLVPGSCVAVLSCIDILRLVLKVITAVMLLVSLSQQPLFSIVYDCIELSFMGWVLWIGEVLSIFFLLLEYRNK